MHTKPLSCLSVSLVLVLVRLVQVHAYFEVPNNHLPHKDTTTGHAAKQVKKAAALDKTFWYGGERKTLDADALVKQAMGYGMQFHVVRHLDRPKEFMNPDVYLPPNWLADPRSAPDGSFAAMSLCNQTASPLVEKRNAECGSRCPYTVMHGIIWGTLRGMDWAKDGVLFESCSILRVTNAGCHNFPNGCHVQAEKDLTQDMNESNIESGAVTLNGQAKTIDELKQATIALAHKIKLSITLPNGRKSRAG